MERERGNERRNLKSILSWNEFCLLLWKSLLNWRLAISQYLNSNSNQYFNFKSNLVRSMPIIIAFRKFKRFQVVPQMRYYYSTATWLKYFWMFTMFKILTQNTRCLPFHRNYIAKSCNCQSETKEGGTTNTPPDTPHAHVYLRRRKPRELSLF